MMTNTTERKLGFGKAEVTFSATRHENDLKAIGSLTVSIDNKYVEERELIEFATNLLDDTYYDIHIEDIFFYRTGGEV